MQEGRSEGRTMPVASRSRISLSQTPTRCARKLLLATDPLSDNLTSARPKRCRVLLRGECCVASWCCRQAVVCCQITMTARLGSQNRLGVDCPWAALFGLSGMEETALAIQDVRR
jgi:hypothetical protein